MHACQLTLACEPHVDLHPIMSINEPLQPTSVWLLSVSSHCIWLFVHLFSLYALQALEVSNKGSSLVTHDRLFLAVYVWNFIAYYFVRKSDPGYLSSQTVKKDGSVSTGMLPLNVHASMCVAISGKQPH